MAGKLKHHKTITPNARVAAKISLMVRMIKKSARMSPTERGFLIKALIALLWARIEFSYKPTDKLFRYLQHNPPSYSSQYSHHKNEIKLISWAVQTAAAYLPWRTDCTVQAIAAKRLLAKRAIASDFYVGVKNDEASPFSAHAWLMCESTYVTGYAATQFTSILEPTAQHAH